MTDTETTFTATININNSSEDGTDFTVEADNFALDYSSPPSLDLTIVTEKERVTVTIQQGMEEDEAGALAAALLRACEAGRAAAKARGYYSYIADGKPEYGPPYEWQATGRFTGGSRDLLVELMKDADLVGRPRSAFTHLPLTEGFDATLAALDAAGFVERMERDGQTLYLASAEAWITEGSRRSAPTRELGDSLADAVERVSAFVDGDDTHILRVSDLAALVAAARKTLGADTPAPSFLAGETGRLTATALEDIRAGDRVELVVDDSDHGRGYIRLRRDDAMGGQ